MLLYPTVCDSVEINVRIYGFRVRVATINLAQRWQDIAADLSRIAGS
jgi:hypothetical protein